MKIYTEVGFQGDLMFRRMESVPTDARKERPNGRVVISHSETGHHHVLEGKLLGFFRKDNMICYLRFDEPCDIVHERPFDTHETVRLTPGVWEVRRQREWAPEGWRRVED